jgi:hypothetical protein
MRRAVTLAVALAIMVLCAALIVREVALATGQAPPWRVADLWHDLLTEPRSVAVPVGVAAVVAGALCLWLALGMLGGGRAGAGAAVELGDPPASVVVKSRALEHLLAHRLVDELPEVSGARVRVTRDDHRVAARASLSLVAADVRQTFARARAVVERELRAATGLDIGELTVEVDELLAGRGGVT